MPRSLSTSDLATSLSTDRCCRRPILSESIASSRSSLFTWWLWPKLDASRRSLNCTAGSMPSTPLPLTSACPYSDGQSLEAPSLASGSILRLTSLRRYPYSTELPMPRCMMSTRWTGSHTSLWRAMCLTEAILTSSDSIASTRSGHSLSSEKRVSLHTRLPMEKAYWMGLTMSSKTKAFGSQKRRIRRNIPESSEGLSTMLLSCIAVSYTTRTTSFSVRRTSPCSINIGGRWSCSSNGSSSIFRSSGSGENPKMLCAYRFTSPSSPIVSSGSLSTTSSLDVPLYKSCESWAVSCSPRTASETCSNLSDKRQRRLMTDSFILTSNLINIY